MKTNLTAPHFTDKNKAREYLEALRWSAGVVCPHCGSVAEHYQLQGKAHRPGLWKCKDCREQFSVMVGTVFERSKIPLNKWLLAVQFMAASKKGMSAHQMHRMLGLTYKTAWFMAHRIREAMKTGGGLLGSGGGIVEVDETYWGNAGKQPKGARGAAHKMKVISLVERDGQKRSFHVANVNEKTLRPILKAQIDSKAKLMTDESSVYKNMDEHFALHATVNHSKGEYASRTRTMLVSTNTVESSFALLKRGLVGTFHHVSEQHLQRYATEFDFRWNHRKTTDDERAAALLGQVHGKRLTYKQPDAP